MNFLQFLGSIIAGPHQIDKGFPEVAPVYPVDVRPACPVRCVVHYLTGVGCVFCYLTGMRCETISSGAVYYPIGAVCYPIGDEMRQFNL